MPAVLTHQSIMLMARERLRQVRDALQARLNSGGSTLTITAPDGSVVTRPRAGGPQTDLEHRLLFLATRAWDMMSGPPIPSLETPAFPQAPFGDVNKFAVMGSMGPDITAFSAIFAPGQAWVFDTVHKGSPDQHREYVVARTTDFVFSLYFGAVGAILEDHRLEAPERREAVLAMQGYALGHLCHIAGDVISHPYVNDVEWHERTTSHRKFSHAGGEGAIDAQVARQVLLRKSTREGQGWDAWWPTVDEVPSHFFTAYAEALATVHESGTLPRARCFGEFLERFDALGPPGVSADFVRDGYHFYRHAILSHAYGLGQWGWVGTLVSLLVPMVAVFPIAAALPNAGRLFRPAGRENDRAWPELLALPIALGSPIALGYGVWLLTLSTMGVEARSTFGILNLAIPTVLAVIYFTDVAVDMRMPPWLRWLLFVALPLASSLALLVTASAELASEDRKVLGGATLVYALPAFYFAVFFLTYGIAFLGERELLGDDTARIAYIVIFTALLALILFLVLALSLSKSIRDARIPEDPDPFPAEDRHFVRLFDDATLYADGEGQRVFPSAGRKLLKLWWDGPGEMHVRSSRYQLEWSLDGTTARQTVPAPIAPTTLEEYRAFLTATVTDGSGATGNLKTARVYPADLDYQLPPGAVFSDHGDDAGAETREDHDREAAKFTKLGGSETDDPFILRHAPKPAQAVRFGPGGPVAGGPLGDPWDGKDGYRYVAEPAEDTPGDTLMDYAADVAAILCMAAVPDLAESTVVGALLNRSDVSGHPVTSSIGAVAQVFRNWSLDRRRLNEWRMMVAGGAVSEKRGHPERSDAAMRRPTVADWHPDPTLADAEQVANALGWVPLLRQWLDLVKTGEDLLAGTARRPNEFRNLDLSRAVAFLFDLPAPAALADA